VRKELGFLTFLVALLGMMNCASGATITWTDGYPWSSLWRSALNWNPPKVPGPNDEVYINSPPEQGPVIDYNVTVLDISGPRYDSDSNQGMHILGGTVRINGRWEFGNRGSGTAVINIGGNNPDVTVQNEIRHREGKAEIYISGAASLTCNDRMRLADFGSATLDINGEPKIIIAGDLSGGYGSSGWFETRVRGGSLTIGGSFHIGNDGSGIIDVSGGTVDCRILKLDTRPNASTGVLNVSGGTIHVEEILQVSDGNGAGEINLSGGDVNTGELRVAGCNANCIINMTGGSLVARGALMAPKDPNGTVTIHLYGGAIECGSFTTAAAYAMDVNEGVLIIDGNVAEAILADVNNGYITPCHTKDYIMVDYNNVKKGRTTVWAVPHSEVVPDVVGINRREAEAAIIDTDLVVGTVVEEYNDIIPADEVISQAPNGGTIVPLGSAVELVVSLGRPVVPEVVGMTEADANSAITAVDALTVGSTAYDYHNTVPAGLVISQNPAGNTAVLIGSSVDLLISLGQPVVPDVVGRAESAAIAAIEAVDNLTATTTDEYHNTVAASSVITQNPAGGTSVLIGSTIVLTVSLGRPVVPNVVGMSQADATTAIEAVDTLGVGSLTLQYNDAIPAGVVISQFPVGGTVVPVSYKVSLTVSLGRPVVPDVVGAPQADAAAAIEAVDNLTVGNLASLYSNTVPTGSIISQNPAGGTSAPIGSTVDLVISLGRPVVPDVVGMTGADATTAIEAVDNLSVGTIVQQFSNTVEAGLVISQNPAGNAAVPIGSTVDLVVSLGRPVVPNVVGMTEAEANSVIIAIDNLTVGVVNYEYSDTAALGAVISQNPAGNTAVFIGSSVSLSVSLGQPIVPNVVGMNEAEANSVITAVDNLTVGAVTYEYNNTAAAGNVISHNPSGGSAVSIGSSVDLVVSLGQPIVPDVVGMNETDANSSVTSVDNLAVGTVTYQYNDTVTAGSVIGQNPAGNTAVPIGSLVNLVVSLGRPVVPNAVGMTEAEANSVITAIDNLTVGAVTYEYSDTAAVATIVSQNPAGNTPVLIGSSVWLVVSLGRPVVPNVVGMNEADANSVITAVDNLTVGNPTYEYSDTVTAGLVIAQIPVGNTAVPIGSSVHIVVSLGQPVVPDVAGMTEGDAKPAITAVDNLKIDAVTYAYSDIVPAGLVISQNPGGGASVPVGSSVYLLVSLGQPVVPDVVGMIQTDAGEVITTTALLVGAIAYEYSDIVPAYVVISQTPPAGTPVPTGSTVDLIVSLGRPVTPEVVGMTEAEARAAIEAVDNLTVGSVTEQYSNTAAAGLVISQDPTGGTTVAIGSSIDLSVSLGRPVVPNVIGMSGADATTAIEAVDNLTVGTVTQQYSMAAAGLVIGQDPAGSTAVSIGTTVHLLVSLGRPVVPNVIGQSEADAVAAIQALDSLKATVTYIYHETVPEGNVISQDPVEGTVVDIGTTVRIVVSAGKPTLTDLGGYRLVELQNNDGGWDRPLNDGDPNSASDPYTFASGAMGLAQAYRQSRQTNEPVMRAALEKAGKFLTRKVHNFVSGDGALAVELDRILGGTVHRAYVKANFYDKLAAGTFADARSGLFDCNTAEYVQAQRARYTGTSANLAAWDLGLGLYNAQIIGASTAEWIAGVKAEIEEMDGNQPYDVLGLAGALLGLAVAGEDFDPQTGEHAAASSLSDLAEVLAGYQLGTGGFTWWGVFMEPGVDETVRETVCALMALSKFDRTVHLSEIAAASAYLQNAQLATAGWENYTGSVEGENNEITGETLTGIAAGIPMWGDFDKDGDVDLADFALFASAWMTADGDTQWNPDCDIGVPYDNSVNILDLAVFADNWLTGIK